MKAQALSSNYEDDQDFIEDELDQDISILSQQVSVKAMKDAIREDIPVNQNFQDNIVDETLENDELEKVEKESQHSSYHLSNLNKIQSRGNFSRRGAVPNRTDQSNLVIEVPYNSAIGAEQQPHGGQTPRKKRIIIKDSSQPTQVLIGNTRAQSSSRRPPTAERKRNEESKKTSQTLNQKVHGSTHFKQSTQIEATEPLYINKKSVKSLANPVSKNSHARNTVNVAPGYNQLSFASEVNHDEYKYAQNQDEDEDPTSHLFDKVFDQIKENLENPETVHAETIIDENEIMRQMAEKMRKEALARYENQTKIIKDRYITKQKQLETEKDFLHQQKEKLNALMNTLDAKSTALIESISSLTKRELNPPLLDQSWKLVQNWLFSLITEQEKCVRYARAKQMQQIDHVQKEKLKYQEGRNNMVIQQIQKIKNFPFFKITNSSKALRPCSKQLQDYLKENFGDQFFEHVGTIRCKPYLKFAKPSQNKSKLYYTYLSENQSPDQTYQFPSVSMLLRDAHRILKSNEELLHITQPKFKLSFSYGDFSQDQLQQIILNDVISPLQDSDLTSKRELRVFVCAKEVQECKKERAKNLAEIISFQDMLENQDYQNGGWSYKMETDKQGQPLSQIKRLKNTNQLKMQNSETEGTYSLLSECKLKHLLQSLILRRYFDNEQIKEDGSLIENFYVIEENSLFNVSSHDDKLILNSSRKIRHFRKLSDMEVVILIFKSLGHLISNPINQYIELKMSQEALKKLHTFEQNTNQQDTFSQVQTTDWKQYNYLIVNTLVKENSKEHLLKQYLIRFAYQDQPENPQISHLEPYFCMYPNCLQQVMSKPQIESKFPCVIQSPQLPQSNQTFGTKKQRPESAGNRNNSSATATINLQKVTKKMTRLPILFELEMQESPLVKVLMKRFKGLMQQQSNVNQQNNQQQILNKDKSAKVFQGSQNAPQGLNSVQQAQTLEAASTKSSQTNVSSVPQQSKLVLCQYHHEFEQFLLKKLCIQLQPVQLRPNNFNKALKNFSNWREELKGSLIYDFFAPVSQKQNRQGNLMQENISKIVNFSVNDSLSQTVDVSSIVEVVYQNQPQVINYLENYYQWIGKVQTMQKSIYQKNKSYQEANEHFLSQLKAFNLNLKQAKDNEVYLAQELKKWVKNPQFLQTIQTALGNATFSQILEIVRSKDVIFKFQQFQALAEKVNSGTLLIEAQQMDLGNGYLPKIGSNQFQNDGSIPQKAISNLTHTAGFFQKQDSFHSNKVIDKLTMIYGGGAPQIGQNSMQNNIQGTGQIGANFNGIKKQASAPPIVNHPNGMMIQDIQTFSGKGGTLNPLQRKYSAGSKKNDYPDQQQNSSGQQYYSSHSQNYQNDSRLPNESPQSNKTFKNIQRNEIILPPPVSMNQLNAAANKQRANSAHKYNQNLINNKISMQQNQGISTLQQPIEYRAITNLAHYDQQITTPNFPGQPPMYQYQQNNPVKRMIGDLHSQAAAVAQTFQQPPPSMKYGANQQFLPTSLVPIQHATQKQTRGPIMAQAQPLTNNLLPIQGTNNLLSSNLTQKQIKQLEKQQIIVNAYTTPLTQAMVSQPSSIKHHTQQQQQIPSNTSIGFHPKGQGSLQQSTQQHRVSSAHADKDSRKKQMLSGEQAGAGGSVKERKKSKKKQISKGENRSDKIGGVQDQYSFAQSQ